MNRRDFLRVLGIGSAAAAAATILPDAIFDPERLLWTPGQRTIFLPPEKSFIGLSSEDMAALKACFRGWFATGYDPTTRLPISGTFSVEKAIAAMSDETLRASIARGKRVLEGDLLWTPSRERRRVFVEHVDGRGHVRTRTR